jgi:hypothetical protein
LSSILIILISKWVAAAAKDSLPFCVACTQHC